jgi:MoCo/4Fe-4S cofactor protein with predicted Tat translocation signal
MKKYWRSVEELDDPQYVKREMAREDIDHKNALLDILQKEPGETQASRRDFLKMWGIGITASVVAAACERPVQKAIPYVIKPEEITPGVANHYASTFFDGEEYCSLLVKSREGRPIKIEGNKLSGITFGGTSARVQASVLNLYDNARYTMPMLEGKETSWQKLDEFVMQGLEAIGKKKGNLVLLTPTVISPSLKALLINFIAVHPGTRHIQYDAFSSSALLQANEACFGIRAIPDFLFDRAKLIVSFNADFLGTWLMPVRFAKQYSRKRKLDKGQETMSEHIQLESGMSLTGSNADIRIPVKPSQEIGILSELYSRVAQGLGKEAPAPVPSGVDITDIAVKLVANKGESLLISSTNNLQVQVLIAAINYMLGNYNSTLDLNHPLLVRQGIDQEMISLTEEMNAGSVDGIILFDVNPVYDYPARDNFIKGLDKVAFKLSISCAVNETASLVQNICPDSHYLEKWNDAEPKKGFYSLAQPLISAIYETRQAEESIMKWAGKEGSYYDFIRSFWKDQLFGLQKEDTNFGTFWDKHLQSGIYEPFLTTGKPVVLNSESVKKWLQAELSKSEGIELICFQTVAIGSGRHANNPWLQEMPDPIVRLSWDNVASVSPKMALEMGLATGTLISIDKKLKAPVFIQPGQAYGTISIALGYGHTLFGKVADGVGVDVNLLVQINDAHRNYVKQAVTIEKTTGTVELALSQTHHSMEGRPIIRETSLDEWLKDPASGNEMHAEFEKNHQTLYPETKYDGFHWGMSVDLNSCIGCGACTIACQSENNIPVVGKEQVKKRRLMHWIRVDRYYTGTDENPEVLYQPVMCQHCEDAPCENVCPVSATNHSNEGLNQMAYNRCIGTKYCINNCPYRVRRFNWFRYVTNKAFDYNQNSDLGRMVLNPDVVVRERGVVEKCSFCVQRIQETKLKAKLENRQLNDGEVQPACVQACPADALKFGNIRDTESQVSKHLTDARSYHLLEELHTLPSVSYLTRVRNKKA